MTTEDLEALGKLTRAIGALAMSQDRLTQTINVALQHKGLAVVTELVTIYRAPDGGTQIAVRDPAAAVKAMADTIAGLSELSESSADF